MGNLVARRSARIRYRLTEQGGQKLREAFHTSEGRRKFSSVPELDARTVARIYYNEEPFDLTSLILLFRACKLELTALDYKRARTDRSIVGNTQVLASPGVVPECSAPSPPTESFSGNSEMYDVHTGEPNGGVETLYSRFYIERKADELLKAAIRRRDSTILLKGPRHCGKSSLLARGLQEARSMGFLVVYTDFDALGTKQISTDDTLYRALVGSLALQGRTDDFGVKWQTDYPPLVNLESALRSFLGRSSQHVVWAMDGVDALVGCGFHEDVFAMFRGWHNCRQYEPGGPWDHLTLLLTYAADASLLISSDELSPFNVSTPILIPDLSREDVSDMNRRYGSPLRSKAEEDRLFALCSGHPFLTRLVLFEVTSGGSTLDDIERMPRQDGGPFGPYLDEIRQSLQHYMDYKDLVSAVAAAKRVVATAETNRCFQRLCSAGVLKGKSVEQAVFRCELYRIHFARYPL